MSRRSDLRDAWQRNRPGGWSAAQRRVIGVLGLGICIWAVVLFWRHRVFLPDPPPAVGPRAGELLRTLDPNTASAAELAALPGIGPSRAAAIVGYREAGEPFASIEDLQAVPGIGPALAEAMRLHLRFGNRSGGVESGDVQPPASGRQ